MINPIVTETEIRVIGSDVEIVTRYIDDNGVYVFLSEVVGSINSVPYIEGDGVVVESELYDRDFYVNDNGDLIVLADDALNFSIEELTGQLQYTE